MVRKLMSPAQKLLASSTAESSQNGDGLRAEQPKQEDSSDVNFNNLNEDDQEMFRRLYEKAKRQ